MPISFELMRETAVFCTAGEVDYEDGLKVLQDGFSVLKSLEPPHKVLFDIRQSTEHRTPEELRAIVTYIAGNFSIARIALLVKSDYYFGMSRMFEAFAEIEGLETEVFRDTELAWQWLEK